MNIDKPKNGTQEAKAARAGSPSPGGKRPSRRKAATRSSKPRAPSKRAAGGRAARPSGKLRRNKAEFVRNQPVGMPARDVVAAAARLGMIITPDYVHKVRSTAKARSTAPSGKPARRPSARSDFRFAKPLGVLRAGTPEAAFRKLVLELGLQRAKDLLADVERKLGALIHG
jgi:hypothetical protein